MKALRQKLKQNPVFYVTRDIERALGMDLNIPNFFIISNYSDFAKGIADKHDNVFLIKEEKILDTWELLKHKEVQKYISRDLHTGLENLQPNIIIFKNTPQIERICKENNLNLLNPSADLSNKIEEKVSQLEWAEELKKYFPKYEVKQCKDIKWKNKEFILQFNRSHTGSGTFLIKSKKQIQEIKEKFPLREARIADYIEGPLLTNNNIVWDKKILLGNINYQITGLKPFTDKQFTGVGNDWALPHKILSDKQIDEYYKIAKKVGEKMMKDGWKGLYGIDVVMNKKTGELFLLEINARQPASTSFESILQRHRTPNNDNENNDTITTFEAHLASLLGLEYKDYELIKIDDGAQVVQRVGRYEIRDKRYKKIITKLENFNMKVIHYNNTKPNSDLLRIQSEKGVMERDGEFGDIGKNIIDIIDCNN